IATFGTLPQGRKVIQPVPAESRRFYEQACEELKHPLLTFSSDDMILIGSTCGRVIQDRGYTCYACAIMPDHVHLLIRRHRDRAEEMLASFQTASREALIAAGRRQPTHPVWGGPGWKVFLNTPEDIERVVAYIRQNPVKVGQAEQQWGFVKPYDGWMPAYRR